MRKAKKNLKVIKTTKAIVLKKIKIRNAKIPYLISFTRKVFNKNRYNRRK